MLLLMLLLLLLLLMLLKLLLLLMMLLMLLLMVLLLLLLLLHGIVKSNGRVNSRMVIRRLHIRHLLMLDMALPLLHHQWLVSLLSTSILAGNLSRFIQKIDLPVLCSPRRHQCRWFVLPGVDKVETYSSLALSIALFTIIAMRHGLITLEMPLSTCQTARPHTFGLRRCSILLVVAIVASLTLHFDFSRTHPLDFFARLGTGGMGWRLALLRGRGVLLVRGGWTRSIQVR